MATVLELAQHAGVSTETVLRVILREPVNEAARRQVAEAIELLGMPDYPRPDGHIEVLPAEPEPVAGVAVEPAGGGEPAFVEEVRGLFRELVQSLHRERRERVDDLALTTDLMVEGWKNVDRRLGRLEKMIERLDRRQYLGDTNGNGNGYARGNGNGNGNGAARHRREFVD